MPKLDRRSLLVGSGLLLSAACSRQFATPGSAAETDRPLPIPALLDARQRGQVIALSAQAGKTSFYPGRPSDTLGYNGSYLGPTLKVHRGDEVKVAVTNRLAADWREKMRPD